MANDRLLTRSPGGLWRHARNVSLAALTCAAVTLPQTASAETKGFVVNWFHAAADNYEGECPKGPAVTSTGLYVRILKELGIPDDEAAVLMEHFANMRNEKDAKGRTAQELAAMRGRINGQPVKVYNYPESVPDPNMRTAEGKFGYGFDLDGKIDANDFEDPETHEKGIDNQAYRAYGCMTSMRAKLPDRPSYPANQWNLNRNIMPAWVLSVTGDDLSKDGPVTITFDRALEHVTLDAKLEALRDATYRINPDPRSHVVVPGKIEKGVLTTTAPFDLTVYFDATVYPDYNVKRAKLRLNLEEDGAAKGYIGGYQPWVQFVFLFSQAGLLLESMGFLDMPGLYYAMKKMADADPDPVTGQNQLISSTHRMELVPAFLVPSRVQQASAGDSKGK